MQNRLTKYGNVFTAGYRSDGKRAWREVNGKRIYFLYDGDNLLAELGSDGQLSALNTWGPTGLVARDTFTITDGVGSIASVAYLHDPLGNVAQRISVQSGEILSTYQFDAYGNLVCNLDGNGVNVGHMDAFDPYGYKGKYGYYTELSIGLILCTNRYYDSTTGRWLTRDPIGYSGGLNLYAYCGGDPVNGIDPSGYLRKQTLSYRLGGNRFSGYSSGGNSSSGGAGASSFSSLDGFQLALDVGGCVPVVGEICDVINVGVCLYRGDFFGAGASAISIIPVFGDIVGKSMKAGRYAVKAVKIADEASKVAWVTHLPAEELEAVSRTLSHIENKTKPTGKLSRKWGTTFENRLRDLPEGVTYLEHRVAPGSTGENIRRIVTSSDGKVYYTWNHYGTAAKFPGDPSFVRMR